MVCMCRKPYRQKHLCDLERILPLLLHILEFLASLSSHIQTDHSEWVFCNTSYQPFAVKNLVLPQ
jgi:hypothetical protein